MSKYLAMAASLKKVEDGLYELRTVAGTLAAENAKLRDKQNNRKKLTKREVVRIRQLKADGWKQSAIADAFDVNRATVSRIVRNIYWSKG